MCKYKIKYIKYNIYTYNVKNILINCTIIIKQTNLYLVKYCKLIKNKKMIILIKKESLIRIMCYMFFIKV